MIFASYISGSNPKYKTRKEEADMVPKKVTLLCTSESLQVDMVPKKVTLLCTSESLQVTHFI